MEIGIIILALLMAAYLLTVIVSGIVYNRRYKGVCISQDVRITIYRRSMVESWIATLVLGVAALFAGLSMGELGLSWPVFRFHSDMVLSIVVLVVVGIFAVLTVIQIIGLLRSNKARQRAWSQLTDEAGADAILKDLAAQIMVPRRPREKRVFTLVCATAAICEEFTMRGVLFVVLLALLPDVLLPLLPILAGVLFGLAHSYQGVSGVIKTALMGIGFSYLYFISGSLLPCIILHFIVDISSRFLYPAESSKDVDK